MFAQLLYGLVLLLATCSCSGADGPWTSRQLSRYIRLRAGPTPQGRVWRGQGVLTNTLSGRRIAIAESLERCTAVGECELGTDRVIVYRDGNGTRLTRPLRYAHNVTMELQDGGHLLLRATKQDAVAADGLHGRTTTRSVLASAWAAGRGMTLHGMLRRARFEISARPVKDDAAADEGPPREEPVGGWPRAARQRDLGITREEYRLTEPGAPGRPCSMTYKRTGRCPHWVGGGVCTLELECTTADAGVGGSGGGGSRGGWLRWRWWPRQQSSGGDGGEASEATHEEQGAGSDRTTASEASAAPRWDSWEQRVEAFVGDRPRSP